MHSLLISWRDEIPRRPGVQRLLAIVSISRGSFGSEAAGLMSIKEAVTSVRPRFRIYVEPSPLLQLRRLVAGQEWDRSALCGS